MIKCFKMFFPFFKKYKINLIKNIYQIFKRYLPIDVIS